MYKIGQKVMVASDNDNECYDCFRSNVLIITHIARNTQEHQGYDDSMEKMALYDFETEDGDDVPCSLYEYEIEEIEKASPDASQIRIGQEVLGFSGGKWVHGLYFCKGKEKGVHFILATDDRKERRIINNELQIMLHINGRNEIE